MLSLFQAFRKVHDQLEMNAGDGRGAGGVDNPVERVRDVLQQANNYFPEAETAAEEFRQHLQTACRRWHAVRQKWRHLPALDVHKAFRTSDRLLLQAAELPNGQKLFTMARTVLRPWSPAGEDAPEFAVVLGCEMHHSRDLFYADALEGTKRRQLDPIGIGCAVCERMDCAQRAHLPAGHEVRFDGNSRRTGLYDLEG